MIWPLTRGQIIQADIGLNEPKLLVVVSNNIRNRQLKTVLTVRLTTSSKPDLPSIVELSHEEGFTGRAVCDDIWPVYDDEVKALKGGLSPKAMTAIDGALAFALALPAPNASDQE